ncbi:MAG TPA: hypothetical protein VHP32_03305 [Ignavibacteria bacterium]|nr:hypothetical protein [Ignavibacteria bacterium]
MQDNFSQREVNDDRLDTEVMTKQGNKMIIFMSIIILLVLVILGLLWITYFNVSDYDRGMDFLAKRNYDQALIYFQKVPAGKGDYTAAQSKINYIQGVKLFNVNDYAGAKQFLTKVNPNDEYYNEVKLMLDKVNEIEKAELLKQQLELDERQQIIDAQKQEEQKIKDKTLSNEYFALLKRLEDKFQSEFDLTKVENSVAMKKNLRNLNDIRQQMLDIKYEALNQDPQLLDYKNALDNWMLKSISFVTTVISENVLSIQDASVNAKNILTDAEKYKEEVNLDKQKLNALYQ